MTDGLDEIERRVLAGKRLIEQDGYRKPDEANAAITIGAALALIERCRKAEKRALYFERQCDTWSRRVESLEAEMKLIDGE